MTDKEKWLEYRNRISMGMGLEGTQTIWIFKMALKAIEHQEKVEKIKKEWEALNNLGKLEVYVDPHLEEAQKLIKMLYDNLGRSADSDHALWMKTKEYCFKNKLVSYEK